jgi:hypothetical protein
MIKMNGAEKTERGAFSAFSKVKAVAYEQTTKTMT